MLENKVQEKVIKLLKSKGAYVIKLIVCTKAGAPDIVACYKGKFLGIEVKTSRTLKNVSDLQKRNLQEITNTGGLAMVVCENDLDFLSETLDNLE